MANGVAGICASMATSLHTPPDCLQMNGTNGMPQPESAAASAAAIIILPSFRIFLPPV